MPQLIKKILGPKNTDSGPTEEQKKAYEIYAREIDKKRRLESPVFNAGENLMKSVGNFGKGLIGFDDADSGESISGSNALGQVLTAGLPFAAIRKGLKNPLVHGTKKVFNKFDPARYDKSDLLGSYTHAAESPEWADDFASGIIKQNRHGNPNIIAIEPESKNVLDLFSQDIDPDDLAAIVGAMPSADRRWLKDRFKQERGSNQLFFNSSITSAITKNPEVLSKTPFDAIKYSDSGNPSWAFPETTPLKTPWGTPMNDAAQLESLTPPVGWKGLGESSGNLPVLSNSRKVLNNKYINPSENPNEFPYKGWMPDSNELLTFGTVPYDNMMIKLKTNYKLDTYLAEKVINEMRRTGLDEEKVLVLMGYFK